MLKSYFSYIHFIFDFSLTLTNGSIRISPVVLLDIKNIGIAVGIVLLACVQTEIYVISYLFPDKGRHLWFLTSLTLTNGSA